MTDVGPWHLWYAWHPVRTRYHGWMWFRIATDAEAIHARKVLTRLSTQQRIARLTNTR